MFQTVRRRAIALVAAIGMMLASIAVGSSAAQADPGVYFGYMKVTDTVLLGQPVGLTQVTACPSGTHLVRAVVVDSENNAFHEDLAVSDGSGNWDDSWFYMPEEATLGAATLSVECILTVGLTVDQTSEPYDIEIIEQSPFFYLDKAHMWGNATFVDYTEDGMGICPSNANGNLYIFGPRKDLVGGPYETIEIISFTATSNGHFSVPVYMDPDVYMMHQDYYTSFWCSDGVTSAENWDGFHFSPGADEYVALGDSFSSGEGSFNNNLTGIGVECHNSTDSYPYLVAAQLDLGLPNFPACSGARTDDLFNANIDSTASQAQFDELTEDTRVVTLTIGGNDLGFSQILRSCFQYVSSTGFGCSTLTSITSDLAERMKALDGEPTTIDTAFGSSVDIHSIKSILMEIQSKSPNAAIFIAGYPRLFGGLTVSYSTDSGAPSGFSCNVSNISGVSITLDYGDAQWINDRTDELNTIIADAVSDVVDNEGVAALYISPSAFSKHGICDSGASWFNKVSGVMTPSGLEIDSESIHPTTTGVTNGYAPRFTYWIGPHD